MNLNKKDDFYFFGKNLPAEDFTRVNWKAKSVGEPVTWPESLKVSLYLIAQTDVPSCVCWGRDFTYFANQPFTHLYSCKNHPALGDKGKEFFESTLERLQNSVSVSYPLSIVHKASAEERFDRSTLIQGRYTISSIDGSNGRDGFVITCVPSILSQAEGTAKLSADMDCAFYHTDLGVTLLALNGDCLAANPAFSNLLGYTQAELLASSCQKITHPDDLEPTLAAYERLQKKRVGIQKLEKRFLKKDGTVLLAQTSVSCVRDLEGKAIAIVVVTEDIEERMNNQNQLIRAKEEAESANRLKSAFLANMSHEIRTPLGIMMGFSDLLCDDLSMQERITYANTLKKNGEQLSVIINDILDLSKVESGFLHIDVSQFSLRDALNDVFDCMKLKAEEKRLTFTVEIVESACDMMTSDPMRLKQILMNVVGNAIKFTHDGGIKLTVLHNNGQLDVEISDSGVGMSQANQAHLFSPFQQADTSITRQYGGTGLGLALSKRLAQLMSGDLVLKESFEGVGSTFKLTIRNHVPTREVASASQVVSKNCYENASCLSGISVLLVDDSEDNQFLIATILRKAGAVLDFADDGLEGFKLALNGKHDLVLMDIQMPILDGYSATQRLREAGYRKPIIALTAHAMNGIRRRCLDVGCDDHLCKPIDSTLLLRTVSRLFNRSKSRVDQNISYFSDHGSQY